MIPPVCLAGALFFYFWHVPFQKNTYIAIFGTKIGPNHFVVKTNSVMIPPVCLAGALFFQKKHAPFQKNMYVGVLGSKYIKNLTLI